MWKLSIDIAERNGALLRRALRSAERLSDSATARGLRWVKTPFSRSSALLVRITRADQRRALVLGMSFPLQGTCPGRNVREPIRSTFALAENRRSVLAHLGDFALQF